METVLNIFAPYVSLLAAAIALYVSFRLATFKSEFLDLLNGKYLSRNEADLQKQQNDRDHERYDKAFNAVWKKIHNEQD